MALPELPGLSVRLGVGTRTHNDIDVSQSVITPMGALRMRSKHHQDNSRAGECLTARTARATRRFDSVVRDLVGFGRPSTHPEIYVREADIPVWYMSTASRYNVGEGMKQVVRWAALHNGGSKHTCQNRQAGKRSGRAHALTGTSSTHSLTLSSSRTWLFACAASSIDWCNVCEWSLCKSRPRTQARALAAKSALNIRDPMLRSDSRSRNPLSVRPPSLSQIEYCSSCLQQNHHAATC